MREYKEGVGHTDNESAQHLDSETTITITMMRTKMKRKTFNERLLHQLLVLVLQLLLLMMTTTMTRMMSWTSVTSILLMTVIAHESFS